MNISDNESGASAESSSLAPAPFTPVEAAYVKWMEAAHGRDSHCLPAFIAGAESGVRAPAARLTRVEVIDETGRAYVRHAVEVTTDIQDEGRTLKVFVRAGGPVEAAPLDLRLAEIRARVQRGIEHAPPGHSSFGACCDDCHLIVEDVPYLLSLVEGVRAGKDASPCAGCDKTGVALIQFNNGKRYCERCAEEIEAKGWAKRL